MTESFVFLADGFEEVEALTVVDVLRRAGIPVKTVSITDSLQVTGAHGVTVNADLIYCDASFDNAGWLILPGGMPGSQNLRDFGPLCDLLKSHAGRGGRIAAICAAPAIVLCGLRLLDGHDATCYPGMEHLCEGANMIAAPVVVSGNFVLGNGPANAMQWAIAIVRETMGDREALEIANALLLYPHSHDTDEYCFG